MYWWVFLHFTVIKRHVRQMFGPSKGKSSMLSCIASSNSYMSITNRLKIWLYLRYLLKY